MLQDILKYLTKTEVICTIISLLGILFGLFCRGVHNQRLKNSKEHYDSNSISNAFNLSLLGAELVFFSSVAFMLGIGCIILKGIKGMY